MLIVMVNGDLNGDSHYCNKNTMYDYLFQSVDFHYTITILFTIYNSTIQILVLNDLSFSK